MLLQRGRFVIKSINELEKLDTDKDGLKKIIDLDYMGKFEYEGNAIPLSRMYIEYFRENYEFRHFDVYDANGEQMIVYCDKEKDIEGLPEYLLERNYSFYEHVKYSNKEYDNDFWWNIGGDYFIFFGEGKKELINYFVNGCFERDGGKQLIKEKIAKCGYKVE